jgi:hypothetical protein
MSVALYMDVHVRRAVTNGLRLRGVDVLTTQEDGTARWPDDRLLDRAGELGRILFSQDDDLLAESEIRQREGRPFAGVIYAHQLAITIGQCVKDLKLIAKAADPEDLANRVEFLPL